MNERMKNTKPPQCALAGRELVAAKGRCVTTGLPSWDLALHVTTQLWNAALTACSLHSSSYTALLHIRSCLMSIWAINSSRNVLQLSEQSCDNEFCFFSQKNCFRWIFPHRGECAHPDRSTVKTGPAFSDCSLAEHETSAEVLNSWLFIGKI